METKNKRKYALMLLVIMMLQVILPTVQIVLNLDVSTVEAADEDMEDQYNKYQKLGTLEVEELKTYVINKYNEVYIAEDGENVMIEILDEPTISLYARKTKGAFAPSTKNLEINHYVNHKLDSTFKGGWRFDKDHQYVIIGNNIIEVKEGLFKSNKGMQYLFEYGSMERIGAEVFSRSKDLKYIYGFQNVTEISHEAFRDCKNLTTVTGFSSIIHIEEGAFRNCKQLTKINENGSLGGKCLTIGKNAFYDSGLKYLSGLGEGCQIGEGCFTGAPMEYLDARNAKDLKNKTEYSDVKDKREDMGLRNEAILVINTITEFDKTDDWDNTYLILANNGDETTWSYFEHDGYAVWVPRLYIGPLKEFYRMEKFRS